MKCLVTGGCGFIGRHVMRELLARGFEATAYDIVTPDQRSSSFTHIAGDIRDLPLLAMAIQDCDMIIHLAGLLGTEELFENPGLAIENNILGGMNVILTAVAERRQLRVFIPTKPNEWDNLYSVTSQALEKVGHAYRANYGLDVRVLRFWNVFGPAQQSRNVRKAIPYFISQALSGQPLEIYGDGAQFLRPIFVRDVAKTIVDYMIASERPHQTYEMAGRQKMSVCELANMIIGLSKSGSELVFKPMRKGEDIGKVFQEAPDVSQIAGEGQETPLLQALQITIDWLREAI